MMAVRDSVRAHKDNRALEVVEGAAEMRGKGKMRTYFAGRALYCYRGVFGGGRRLNTTLILSLTHALPCYADAPDAHNQQNRS
jgi:hypothetical protein